MVLKRFGKNGREGEPPREEDGRRIIIDVRDITKVYQMGDIEVHALRGVTLRIFQGEFVSIMGPSGSGKSTLMNILGALDQPTGGDYFLDGTDVGTASDVQLARIRNEKIGFVFQNFNLLKRTSAVRQVELPLIYARKAGNRHKRAVGALEAVGLGQRLDHLPSELSGGQQQRTAIARALVKEAHLLLLDEPLANLDYKLREELRVELQEIFAQREAIVVYTTTEPSEALMLGGNIVVLDEGRVLQTGLTPDVYHNPTTTKVADVFSDPPINYLPGTIQERTASLGGNVEFPLTNHLQSLSAGHYIFGVRPHRLFLNQTSAEDIEIRATVELGEINGSETFIHVNYGNSSLVVQEEGVYTHQMGSEVVVYVNPTHFFVFDEAGVLVASPGRKTFEK
jgi:glycerol transport system ATP-binding protein